MDEGRWVLLIASEVGGTDSVSDRAMERLVDAISKEGYEVVRTSTPETGSAAGSFISVKRGSGAQFNH